MAPNDKLLGSCQGFDWDAGNVEKVTERHSVLPMECEEIFFNQPLVVAEDVRHSSTERGFYALGETHSERKLFFVFTIRRKLIRVISARDMSRKEGKIYEKAENEGSAKVSK